LGLIFSLISFVFNELRLGSTLEQGRRRNEHDRHPSVARRSEVMSMKRIALFALLLVVAAVSAQALVISPRCGVYYRCHYTNYTGPIVQDGLSTFINCPGTWGSLNYATENFQSTFNGHTIWDNRRVVFAKPVNIFENDPDVIPHRVLVATQWEFTSSPLQCKDSVVWKEDGSIDFNDCTDGSSRSCTLVP
jgi:hypothetical protein